MIRRKGQRDKPTSRAPTFTSRTEAAPIRRPKTGQETGRRNFTTEKGLKIGQQITKM